MECGKNAWIERDAVSGKHRIKSDTCKLRICPRCRLRQSNKLKRRLESTLARGSPTEWRFFTLTMRHSNAPLTVQLNNLRKCFRRLRQRSLWKTSQTGSVAVIEVTRNTTYGQWHPHLHIVSYGKYLPQRQLSKAWLQITLTSKVVDVRPLKNRDGAAKYLSAYLAKSPEGLEATDSLAMLEWYDALKGARMTWCNGKLPGRDDEIEEAKPEWISLGKLSDVVARASRGDVDSVQACAELTINPSVYKGIEDEIELKRLRPWFTYKAQGPPASEAAERN
jgi:hypothetical protein